MKITNLTVLAGFLLALQLFSNQAVAQATANGASPNVGQPTQPPSTPGPITGPTSVLQGQTSSYTVSPSSGPVNGATSYAWSLSSASAGTITGTTTSATVQWSASYSGNAVIYCSGVNSKGSSSPAYLSVTVAATAALASGTVSPASQTINYNKAASTLTCSAPTGGSGGYTYQWQSSANNVNWTNISGATSLNYSPGTLTATTYYQLLTTSNGNSAGSNTAQVVVNLAANPANTDTTFNVAANKVFGNLDVTQNTKRYAARLCN